MLSTPEKKKNPDHPGIVLVEDHAGLLESLQRLMSRSGFVVLGAFSRAEDALASPCISQCDFLLVDLELPGMSGVELISQIRQAYPEVIPVVYTTYDDRETVFAALQAGAYGYLLKCTSEEEFLAGLAIMQQGGSPMSPPIARKVIEQFHQSNDHDALSLREIEVLQSIAQGRSAKEIGVQLGVSPYTIYTHLQNIYAKLHVNSKAEAIRKAGRLGLV